MKLRTASWNIEGRLSSFTLRGKGSPEGILDEIEALNADIITLPEAFDGVKGLAPGIMRRIHSLGYKALTIPYKNGGPPRMREATQDTQFMVLSRLDFANNRTLRLANLRNIPVFSVKDAESGQELPITFFGVHLDERSSDFRVRQATELADEVIKSRGEVVAMGDYNDMFRNTGGARLFGTAAMRVFGQWLGDSAIGQLASYAHEMAQGKAMQYLEAHTTLRDADPHHQPTTTPRLRSVPYMPSIRMIGIDHMMVSPGITVSDFEVMKHDGGSDHRAISATIEINP